ncbi:MAG: bifunctional folylpolyglutamate synthase/dihydrofolate synthase [Calditrichaeota bacterium]|nr:MAG: bifunctional folylpolyglutamate synthase/dihydrofolate synthase [Calditrichota bacterium]
MRQPHKEDFAETINFLYSLFKFGIKLGLKNIQTILEELENPETNFKTIHIAGTNGKGSTGAMLQSIFRVSGYKTGFFTSPHLIDFRERIRINGKPIPQKDVIEFVNRMQNSILKNKCTFFETTTAMAFDYFAKENVDVAIIETGLGGTYDSTNVIYPELSLITDIGFDHKEILGETLVQIAKEKAGIIKNNIPLITSNTNKEILDVLQEVAIEKNAELISSEQNSTLELINDNSNNLELNYSLGEEKINGIKMPFLGNHQQKNAKLAITSAMFLSKRFDKISKEAIRNGIQNTIWLGRFTIIEENPKMILDVTHNPDGMKVFVETLQKYFPTSKAFCVIGMASNKDIKTCFGILEGNFEKFVCVTPNVEKVLEAKELVKFAPKNSIASTTVEKGIELAKSLTTNEDIICVIGSHFTVGEALHKIYNKKELLI